MTTEQLRYAVSIAEGKSFSDTAEEFYISQSAVSKQIRHFEWELGCALFERENRKTTLTPAGEKLYPLLRETLACYEALLRAAKECATGKRILRVVSLPFMGQYEITPALRCFETENPGVELRVIEQEEPELLRSLESGVCDVVIARDKILPASYERLPLARDELALFVGEKHPYAERPFVTLDMLRSETFMLMPKYTSIYRQCLELASRAGFSLSITSCARIETILSNIECGRCVSLLMKKAAGVFRSSLIRVVPLEPPCPSVVTAAVCDGRAADEAVKLFMDFMRTRQGEAKT